MAIISLFCRVVDHFGDAGVCLRLAKGLAARGSEVELVIDHLALVHRMEPRLMAGPLRLNAGTVLACQSPGLLDPQTSRGLPDLTIEAFQSSAPSDFLMALERAHSLGAHPQRVMLDYLATEDWAISNQGLLAPDNETRLRLAQFGSHPKGPAAQRIWLAPSFQAAGPGLVRGQWQEASPEDRLSMRRRLLQLAEGRPEGLPDNDSLNDVFLVMAFGYSDAPWQALRAAMLTQGLPQSCRRLVFWTPPGLVLTQEEFDLALQACDLNFVRGEDSFVRAHWAAASRWQVPFVWQPYRQADQAHADKLQGWLCGLLDDESLDAFNHFHWAFNQLAGAGHAPANLPTAWQGLLDHWQPSRDHLQRICQSLADRPSLEDRLSSLLPGSE